MNNLWIGVAAAIVVIGGIAYFLFQGYSAPSTYTTTAPTTQASTSVATTVGTTTIASNSTGTQRFTVEENEYSISPSTINVSAGSTVVLNVRNTGQTGHNLVIQGTSFATQYIASGSNATLTFTAPPAGSYTYFCSVDGHEGLGMIGTLTTS